MSKHFSMLIQLQVCAAGAPLMSSSGQRQCMPLSDPTTCARIMVQTLLWYTRSAWLSTDRSLGKVLLLEKLQALAALTGPGRAGGHLLGGGLIVRRSRGF